MDCRQNTLRGILGISLCIPSPFKKGGSVMLTVEEVREAVKASPFYEKWGE
ncbi:hypothetical protein [Dissulfurispira sp.]|uniref:hypothetical protein n=1 Tax=Dissulfurispira sp. TaxID=2817609 RepID=UPI002FD929E0